MFRISIQRLQRSVLLEGLILCVLLGLGCSSESSSSNLDEEKVVPGVEIANLETEVASQKRVEPIQPACTPTMQDGKLVLNGTILPITPTDNTDYSVYPFDPEHILVAKKHRWRTHLIV